MTPEKQTQTKLIEREETGGCQTWGVGIDKMDEGSPKVQTSRQEVTHMERSAW